MAFTTYQELKTIVEGGFADIVRITESKAQEKADVTESVLCKLMALLSLADPAPTVAVAPEPVIADPAPAPEPVIAPAPVNIAVAAVAAAAPPNHWVVSPLPQRVIISRAADALRVDNVSLSQFGYNNVKSLSSSKRHDSLLKAVNKYGIDRVLSRLSNLAVVNGNTSSIFSDDLEWLSSHDIAAGAADAPEAADDPNTHRQRQLAKAHVDFHHLNYYGYVDVTHLPEAKRRESLLLAATTDGFYAVIERLTNLANISVTPVTAIFNADLEWLKSVQFMV